MELPLNISSSAAVLQHKLWAFQALRGLQKSSAILGQYQAYSGQVRRELQKPDGFQSLTPTFAGRHRSWCLWGHQQLEATGPPSALCARPTVYSSDPTRKVFLLCTDHPIVQVLSISSYLSLIHISEPTRH